MSMLNRNPIRSQWDLEGERDLMSCSESVLNSQVGTKRVPGQSLLGHGLGCPVLCCLSSCIGERIYLFSWFGCSRQACERDQVRLLCDKGQRILKLSLPHLPVLGKTLNSVINTVTLIQTGTTWNIYTRLSVVWNLWKPDHPSYGSTANVLKQLRGPGPFHCGICLSVLLTPGGAGGRRVTFYHTSLWPLWPPTCYHPFTSSHTLTSAQTWEKNREGEKRKKMESGMGLQLRTAA